jgi:hypothetical protein
LHLRDLLSIHDHAILVLDMRGVHFVPSFRLLDKIAVDGSLAVEDD